MASNDAAIRIVAAGVRGHIVAAKDDVPLAVEDWESEGIS